MEEGFQVWRNLSIYGTEYIQSKYSANLEFLVLLCCKFRWGLFGGGRENKGKNINFQLSCDLGRMKGKLSPPGTDKNRGTTFGKKNFLFIFLPSQLS
jgi:hypothetical protein